MKAAVVTPNAADGELATSFLRAQEIETLVLREVADLREAGASDLGCVVLVEEALAEGGVDALDGLLRTQPPWSDLPLVVIAARESPLLDLVPGLFPHSGNVTLLPRPLHPASLVSAVKVALKARAKQLEVRDLIALRESAVQQRDEFLAMLAHELRNPLAPIRNAAYLLGTLEIDHPLFVKCRTMIDKQARHITRLVDDLLDVSRLELGKTRLSLQRVDVNAVVGAAIDSCANLMSARRHTVDVRISKSVIPVHADSVRLEQVVCNLLVNAAKFTPEGGRIEVEARAEGGDALIVVSDNGMGIKPDMLESIFELFTQDDVTIERTKGGLGIGLTLSKRLMELHGGGLRGYSEGVGCGARFEARLPISALVEDAAPPPAVDVDSPPKRILIVEDGTDTRDSLGLLIERWNHQVLYAANGPEGFDRAREARPDVALIDIGLPGFDGYEVAQRIRREGSSWSRSVRLIAVTGYGQESDRARAIEAGFDVHLLKPVDPQELRTLLR